MMIDFEYLYRGICGLANAHKASSMAGHLGAAVAAGYFYGEDHSEMPDKVARGIEAELDRIISGEESFWWNAKKVGVTAEDLFRALPKERPAKQAIDDIAIALQKNVGQTRQSGHNTIFASIAIRALSDHSDYATPKTIAGICQLIKRFDDAHAGRGYYGKEKGWLNGNQVKLTADAKFSPYASMHDLAKTTITELIKTAAVRKQGFGGLWHIINHAAAIIELHRFGYTTLAKAALPAHHQHIQLWRTLPDVESELGAVVKSANHPGVAAYWNGDLKRDSALLTHRIKTMYGYSTLRRLIGDDATTTKADDAFLYLMA